MKIRSPAVVMLPPRLGVPVLIPLASSSSKIPSGTCHAISPVLALTATSSPHGGALQEYRVFGSQKRPPSGVTFLKLGPAASSPPSGGGPPPRPPRPPRGRTLLGSTFSI